ncbi:MAG: protein kinase domain-containing protein [Myxococcota bacterium]
MAEQDALNTTLIPDAPILNAQYRVLELLGEGGMGRVFKAEHRITQQVVAVKALRQELLTDPSFRVRFITEAKALSRFDHSCITHLYNFIEEMDGRLFLVMQFVAGQNLESLIFAMGGLSPAITLTIIRPVLDAFAYAHRQGVVHRDIKPANIVLTPGGGVKVMDFGIARIESDTRITMTGASLGSPGYMSPEQVLGRPLDHRCDIYALGVMLFEMLTGDLPYPGDNGYTVMKAHVEAPIPDPRTFAPAVPEKLAQTVMWAMAKNPDERPQSVDALLNALPTVQEVGGNEDETWRQIFGTASKPRRAPTLQQPPQPTMSAPASPAPSPTLAPRAPTVAGEIVPVVLPSAAEQGRSSKLIAGGLVVGAALLAVGGIYYSMSGGVKKAAPPPPADLPAALVVKGAELALIPGKDDLPAFYMERTEVTFRQYRAFLRDCPVGSLCGPKEEHPVLQRNETVLALLNNHPIANISYRDAEAYCKWAGKHLPSSAEWTRAAQGDDGRLYPWGNEVAQTKAWLARPLKLGSKEFYSQAEKHPAGLATVSVHADEYYADTSPFGVLGLGGSLSEWLQDADSKDENLKLVAGGSWSSSNPALDAKLTERVPQQADRSSASLGLRCVMDAANAVAKGQPEQLSEMKKRGSLRVATEEESPPMIMRNEKGETVGFDHALMLALSKSMNLKLELVPGQYTELPSRLLADRADLMIAAYSPSDSHRGLDWSDSYLEYGLAMVVRKDGKLKEVKDLEGKRVAYYNDDATRASIQKLVPASAKLVALEQGYLEALKAGDVDAFLYDFPFLVEELKSHLDQLKITQFGLTESTYNVGLREGQYSLAQAVNQGIRQLRASPEYARLLKTYLGGAPSVEDIPAGARTIIVKEGDSLQKVAERELGDGSRWPELWTLNKYRIGNQNLLFVGMPLVLPNP